MPLPDGLADLDNKRSRKTRAVPPPRHAKREAPEVTPNEVSAVEPVAELSAAAQVPAVAQEPGGTEVVEQRPVPVTEQDRPAPKRQVPPESVTEPIRLVQVYLPESADDYLRQVRAESLTRRRDVTASAAVRYALEELMRTKTPAELVELLGDKVANGRRGRSRR